MQPQCHTIDVYDFIYDFKWERLCNHNATLLMYMILNGARHLFVVYMGSVLFPRLIQCAVFA